MKSAWNKQRGYTLLELGIAAGIVIILVALAASALSGSQRKTVQWERGEFKVSPQFVNLPPGTATFRFDLNSGIGVDQYGQPLNNQTATAVGGRNVTFTLVPGNPNHTGQIDSLNTTTINAMTGTQPTDSLGIVLVTVSVDDYGSWKLEANVAKDSAGRFGGKEHTIFVSQ